MAQKPKVYIWGFPGIGKSTVRSPHRIVDADCKLFQYHLPEHMKTRLHRAEGWTGIEQQTAYPQNYFDYIQKVDADVVLPNCHPSLRELPLS